MKCILTRVMLVCALAASLCSFSSVSEEDLINTGLTEEQIQVLKEDVIEGQFGTASFPMCHAKIEIPDDFIMLNREQSKKLLVEYWSNPESRTSNVVAVLVPKSTRYFYEITIAYVISYEACGYVSDHDAKNVDYDDLLQAIKEQEKEENKKLPKEQQLVTEGWSIQPYYDEISHTLVWARTFVNPYYTDGDSKIINYDMRILGKEGIISISAVASPSDLNEIITLQPEIIQAVTYEEGYKYSDFKEGKDKVSDWTIGGLVAGGILAKSGLLSKIGILLAKFWKIILVAFVGAGGIFAKWFRRMGKDDEE